MREIEISEIDTRFEGLRLKDKTQEKEILSSILEQGIREPLRCVEKLQERLILLDGFKRLRCSLKLGIKVVPVVSMGDDEATAILQLLRTSNTRGLSILEQAALVDELTRIYGMSVSGIAGYLEKSPAWVSVRLGIIGSMSDIVKDAVFSGGLPVRSYMYTLRQFTRVNKIKKSEIDTFVRAVSGKRLSTRAIDTLAQGYFKGGDPLKEQIRQGNLVWTLNQLQKQDELSTAESVSEIESRALRALELARKFMGRVPYEIKDSRLKSSLFFTRAHALVGGMLGAMTFFTKALQEFYDKGREKKGNKDTF